MFNVGSGEAKGRLFNSFCWDGDGEWLWNLWKRTLRKKFIWFYFCWNFLLRHNYIFRAKFFHGKVLYLLKMYPINTSARSVQINIIQLDLLVVITYSFMDTLKFFQIFMEFCAFLKFLSFTAFVFSFFLLVYSCFSSVTLYFFHLFLAHILFVFCFFVCCLKPDTDVETVERRMWVRLSQKNPTKQ